MAGRGEKDRTAGACDVNHWAKGLLGLAVTGALLWWALSGVDLSEVVVHIRRANLGLLLASSFVVTAGFAIRAMRWKVLLATVKPDTSFQSRFTAVSIHFMANNLLPLRVGEFARAWVFSRVESVTPSAAFGSLVVERFMDAVVLLLFLVVPVLTPGFPDSGALSTGWGGLLLKAGTMAVVVVLAALLGMLIFPHRFLALAERVSPILPSGLRATLLGSLASFLESLAVLRDPRLVTLGFAWSFFFWAWHALSFWLGMLAFGIDTGYVSAIFTNAVVAFGVALPSAPGFLGTFQAAAMFAVNDVYGADAAPALAFAFGYFFASWLPITLIGMGYLWKLGLSLGDVGASQDRVSQ